MEEEAEVHVALEITTLYRTEDLKVLMEVQREQFFSHSPNVSVFIGTIPEFLELNTAYTYDYDL